MEDHVEVFRHLQPFIVERVMSALQREGISCYMEAAGPWGRAPVSNPNDCLSAPANSYFVMVRKDQFREAQEIVSRFLKEGIPSPVPGLERPGISTGKVHKFGALLGMAFIFLMILIAIWYAMGK